MTINQALVNKATNTTVHIPPTDKSFAVKENETKTWKHADDSST